MALFTIRDLKFTYPEQGPIEKYSAQPAIEGLDLEVQEGEFLVICGKSGCGKTTLLRHFKTALTPYGKREGEILFHGEPLEQVSQRRQSEAIGYVLQSPDNQLVTDKVWHELAFGLENLGYPQQTIRLRVAEMASFFGIQGWFYKNVEELSGGQKQLLNLASVMALQPEVLVLDEPTSQLDPITAADFLATIKKINLELGTTIIIIEHRLEDVFPMADRVLVLEDGHQLCMDTPAEVGRLLTGNDLFLALPAPMQIYEGAKSPGTCPLTVREGRRWLGRHCPDPVICMPERDHRDPAEGKEPIIEAKEVWFRYDKNLPDVTKDLSLQVYPGETFCLLGGNGTGKSTLLSLLSGIRRPYRGHVFLEGKDIGKYKNKELFHHFLGVLPQNPQCLFVADTVRQDLEEMFDGREKITKEEQQRRIERVVKDTQIGHLLDSHPYDLSGGEQQRAALAKVLLLEPRIVMLDEPTKGLDGFYKQKLADIFAGLKARGVTILMVSHDIEFCAAHGDRCGMVFDGSVVTVQPAREFFMGNSFYTTAANRIARERFPEAVTVQDVIDLYLANKEAGRAD